MSHHDEGKYVTGDYTSAEITVQMLRRKINMLEDELRNKDERIETLETALNERSVQMKGMKR
jgi:predicted RNase H-like nuclease (RuvC/YqgF family)